jgi:hypothetical protein
MFAQMGKNNVGHCPPFLFFVAQAFRHHGKAPRHWLESLGPRLLATWHQSACPPPPLSVMIEKKALFAG